MRTTLQDNQQVFVRGPCKVGLTSNDSNHKMVAWIETEYELEPVEEIEYGAIAKQLESEGLFKD